MLAECYNYGLNNVQKNRSEAIRLYDLASKEGDMDSSFYLGDLTFKNKDNKSIEKPIFFYKLAIKQGNDDINEMIKQLLVKQQNAQNLLKLYAKFERICARQYYGLAQINSLIYTQSPTHYPPSNKQFYLTHGVKIHTTSWWGQFYRCVPKGLKDNDSNMKALFNFDRLGAVKGYPQSQFYLAESYQFGIGVEKNIEQALHFYQLASQQWDVDATLRLANFREGENQLIEAIQLYQLAKKQAYALALFRFGQCHLQRGSNNLAILCYELAAKEGCDLAEFELGLCYAVGKGVEKNPKEAIKWYQLARHKGNKNAQVCVAEAYLSGEILRKDINEARYLMQISHIRYTPI